jgi:pentatricopeptide repeat protein
VLLGLGFLDLAEKVYAEIVEKGIVLNTINVAMLKIR